MSGSGERTLEEFARDIATVIRDEWGDLGQAPAAIAANDQKPVTKSELDRAKTVHNEQTKMTAGAINTAALALFGGGFILPLVSLSFPLASAPPQGQVTLTTMVVWALIAFGLHWYARAMLGNLR